VPDVKARPDPDRPPAGLAATSPDTTPAALQPAPATDAPAPDSEPEYEPAPRPLPASPAPPPAPTPTAPPAPQRGPLTASASIAALELQGGIARATVDRAVARVVPEYRACYAAAATRAGRHAPGAVRARLVLDETGRARDVTVDSSDLPGLSDCLRDASRQIRSRVAPDVGVVTVTFAIQFATP
jgi:hypothetical protein